MDERIGKVLNFIDHNLFSDLSLARLAREACLSVSQFHRVFKLETGKTPFKVVEEIRVTKAYNLIVTHQAKVYELASQLGYKDYETFSRSFKKHFQLAPDDFKAIYSSVKSTILGQEGEVILTAIKDEEELNDELLERLLKLAEKNQVSLAELESNNVFTIIRSKHKKVANQLIIKNKFLMTSDNKVHKMLREYKNKSDKEE
ncbi:Helix-turn-helix domain-containing protein [Reichenbachiella faecimaris]|uniref:Helix-turn-helix domain-containing protein n=1 Tax=Reichenbachiella faecimaris TaxID=692418 RepID=A0A1W2GHJ2_REIFA|nr:AraC family transcriptional regulator [Reichenbachiella faecimaris]SMD36041.1 Helix-turn-helix domain-containing protein [Reichenbachiella faecimaris]